MGNGPVASAFVLAFQVPNLFRRLLGEGALTAAFIPIFKKKEVEEGEREMWRCANAVIGAVVAATGAITVLAILVLSLILKSSALDPKTRLMFELLRFMFPYMALVCLAAVLIGMANARGHFFIPALGAVLLNLIMISSVFFLAPRMGATLDRQIFGLAIGVLLAGLVQAFFQVPSLMQEGFRYEWISPWKNPTVREVFRKMIPGSIGVAAFQINVLVTSSFSFWFDKSIVSTFNYAVRLMELPQGVFGISLATYLLPTLSGLAAQKKYPEFRDTLKQGLGHLAFANLFASAIALALAEPIVRLLFERGEFGPSATARVALALACLAPGLLMFSMNNIFARAFFALNDIQTPMKISVFCLVLNLSLSIWLVQLFREAGLAVANTMSAGCNLFLLIYALRKKIKQIGCGSDFQTSFVTILGSAILAGCAAALMSRLWETYYGHETGLSKIGGVFVPGCLAGLLYWAAAYTAKVPAAREVTKLLLRK
jgi:putative peptidoglycan lipid II flippase